MNVRAALRSALADTLLIGEPRLTGTSVLLYHSIAQKPSFITDSVRDLEMHLRFIKRSGYPTVFASEAAENTERGGSVCITFDDGYEDNFLLAYPLLREMGIKASIFLITGSIGGTYTDSEGTRRRLLKQTQIEEMQRSGLVEFLPHGHNHQRLDPLDEATIEREVEESAAFIARLSGKRPTVFAYPGGWTSDRVLAVLKRLGFKAAFGVKAGIMRSSSDRFDLPRNFMGHISPSEIALRLTDRLDIYAQLKRLV